MNTPYLPVPDFLPTSSRTLPSDLPDLALRLYQRLAEALSRVETSERQVQEQTNAQLRMLYRVVVLLAAERFEYDRLLRRVLPELEKSGQESIGQVLALHTRTWDETLRRVQIEWRDLTGHILTDELADVVEVESAIPDSTIHETVVRETLFPLILHEGRVVGLAKIVTSVPTR
jgi:hypothetical protein